MGVAYKENQQQDDHQKSVQLDDGNRFRRKADAWQPHLEGCP